jgi:hypothetical protein
MHHQFENLCALAITGQITNSEKAVLDEHMRQCDCCRNMIQQLQPEFVYKQIAPAIAEILAIPANPPEGMRERFLQRAAAAGIQLNAGEVLASSEEILQEKEPSAPVRGSFFSWVSDSFAPFLLFVKTRPVHAIAFSAAFCGLVAAVWFLHPIPHTALSLSQQSAQATLKANPIAAPAVNSQDETLKTELEQLRATLKNTKFHGAQLQASNAALKDSLTATMQNLESLANREKEQRAQVQSSQTQLAYARQQLSDANAQMQLLHFTVAERNKEIQEEQRNLAGMREEMDHLFAARGSAESMISSRNLHIVDVYDTASNGKRQQAFGRVFFVEGQSLVFYAYDLPTPKNAKNFSFQLWGEGGGSEPVAYKLGMMHPDAGGHARWVVSCDNPKMLSQLRAVYIAPVSPRSNPPEQKLMYAYLGHANHP